MGKIKEFFKKHGEKIRNVAIGAAIGAGAVAAGAVISKVSYDLGRRDYKHEFESNIVGDTIHDAWNNYGIQNIVYTSKDANDAAGYSVSDLGKIGNEMVNCGVEEDIKFTHFIAIGPMLDMDDEV